MGDTMRTTVGSGPSGGPRVLTPGVRAALRDAFGGEVSARLPRLLAAGALLAQHQVRGPANETLHSALRDVHALASSAAVVGENFVAEAARECEELLAPYVDVARLPGEALTRILDRIEDIALALAPWVARGAGA